MGNFDPIHIGHINIINTAAEFCDKIWIVPLNYYKSDLSYFARLELCTRLKNIYFRKNVVVNRAAESFMDRYGEPGNYAELVKYILESGTYEYYFICSTDSYITIRDTKTTEQSKYLYENCKFIVIGKEVNGDNIVFQKQPDFNLDWITSDLVKRELKTNTGVPLITHAMYKYFQNNNLLPDLYQEQQKGKRST